MSEFNEFEKYMMGRFNLTVSGDKYYKDGNKVGSRRMKHYYITARKEFLGENVRIEQTYRGAYKDSVRMGEDQTDPNESN